MEYLKLKSGTDIRGVAVEGVEGQPVTLTDQAVEDILASFLCWVQRKLGAAPQGLRLAVGRDSRISAPGSSPPSAGWRSATGLWAWTAAWPPPPPCSWQL